MSDIRLLALDLDDTLLRSDFTISFHTRNAIKRAEAAGVTIVLASGRVAPAMERFSRLLGMNKKSGFLISNNGALVQESTTNRVIHEVRLETETALKICDLADAEGFPVQIYDYNIMYVSRENEFSAYDQKLTGLRQVVVENFRGLVAQGCYKLLIPADPMLLAPLETIIRNYFEEGITLLTKKPYFLEILPQGTNKGTALAKVAEFVGIGPQQCMAIGDSMNDEAMLRWAGLGVAMVNGDDRIKSIADIITDHSNDDDGVAEIIDKYLFNKE